MSSSNVTGDLLPRNVDGPPSWPRWRTPREDAIRADEREEVLAEPPPDTVRLDWVLDNCAIYARDRTSTQIGDREGLDACRANLDAINKEKGDG